MQFIPGRVLTAARRLPPPTWKVTSAGLLMAIFAADILTPLGFAHGTLYLLPVLLATLSLDTRFVERVAMSAALAIGAGMLISPPGFELSYVILNRCVSAAAIAVVAILARNILRYFGALIQERDRVESAHDELLRTQRLARIGARAARLGGWELDLETQTITLSDEACDVLGLPAGLRRSMSEAFSCCLPQWRAALRHAVERCAREGAPFDEICELSTGAGRRAWVRVVGESVRAADGSVRRLQGGLQDIGELRRSRDALERLQGETTLILNAVGEGIHGLDVHGRVTFENPAAVRLLGWTLQDMQGRKAHELIHHHRADGSVYPVEECPIHRVLRDGIACHAEGETFFRRDGTPMLVDFNCSPMKDARGKILGAVLSFRDVTQQHALEQQLRQSQRLESLGQLTGGIAHDFNNLLQVILGNSELLVDQLTEQPRLRELAKMTRTAAERGAQLTHRLLASARRQALDPQPTDIGALLAGMKNLLQRALGEQIDIVLTAADDLWPALIDPAQLENAVLDLCINARDAMPQGGMIRIEAQNVGACPNDMNDAAIVPGEAVLLTIADNGSGMDEVALARAFDPFFTTKDSAKGSGLGLSMVYGFVKQSRGHIDIRSSPGAGTVVRICLPRSAPAPARRDLSPPAAEPSRRTASILVVEDDELVLTHVCSLLRRLGYSIVSARNGSEALKVLRDRTFDLLFTDVMMPVA